MELEKAKEIILKHIDEILTVKTTKWVYDETKEEYIEVDAGRSKEEIDFLTRYQYIEDKDYYKLRDLLEDLIWENVIYYMEHVGFLNGNMFLVYHWKENMVYLLVF